MNYIKLPISKDLVLPEGDYDECCRYKGSPIIETITFKKINWLGNRTFENCINLREINWGETTSCAGDWVFRGCSKLKRVNVTNIEHILYFHDDHCSTPFLYGADLYVNGQLFTELHLKSKEEFFNIRRSFFICCGSLKKIYLSPDIDKDMFVREIECERRLIKEWIPGAVFNKAEIIG